jgi:diguanylate cyclase (GGDEF)-like protein/PAS domain S-box-containing protein
MNFSNEPSARRASVEAARLLALRNLQLLDSIPEQSFDDIVRVASMICGVPFALVSLVDDDRQWFKAKIGVDCSQTGRDVSFCSIAIQHDDAIFEVPDTLEDERFRDNPDVVGGPRYRYYAGVPLRVDGLAIGTLCILDVVPRCLTTEQRESLLALARGALATMEYRQAALALTQADRQLEQSEKDQAVFAAAVAHAQDAIVILGTDETTGAPSRITYVNAAFSKMVGRDFAKTVGRSVVEIATQSSTRAAIAKLAERVSHGMREPATMRIDLETGGAVDVEVTVSELPEQSVDARLIAVLRNVTQRSAELNAAAHDRLESRWKALFARTTAITYTLDRELRFKSSSGGGLTAIGLIPGKVVGMSLHEFFDQSPDRERTLSLHRRALEGESITFDLEVGGRKFKTYLEPVADADANGRIEGVAGLAFDVTDFFAQSAALAETEAHVARAERTAQTGSWLHDLANNRLTYSKESLRMFGVDTATGDREAFYRRIVPEDREVVRAGIRLAYETGNPATFEFRIIAHGSVRFIRESVEISRDALGRPLRADGIFVDITERRLAELDAFRVAYTDDITGLPNRSALRSHLDRVLADGGSAPIAFLMINIDRFRATNDVLGRAAGDRLLRAAGARMQSAVPNAYVARMESDLFVVLLDLGADVDAAASRLHHAFSARFESVDPDADVTISVGIAAIEAGDTTETIAHKAEVAVRTARQGGGNRTVTFSAELEALRNRRSALGHDLFKAVERNQFELNYQPILDASGTIVSLEALLRWNHPAFGRVPPDEFIAIAEENGTIVPIGRWVLRTACRDIQTMRLKSRSAPRVAVNISAKQFSDVGLQLAIHEALALAGLPPDALEVEITETTIAQDPAQATRVLTDLRLVGVKVSVDDFGTGYSSLANLRRFPLDHLKIDRAFVAKIPGDVQDGAIVDAILGLARQLSLGVIAEGVETREQADHLVARGCEMLQGYYFARPLNAEAVTAYVIENRRVASRRRRRGA